MEKQHVILEYDKYIKQYKEKFGEKTIVFMQLGSFYELCAVLEGDVKYGETDIYHICDELLNIAVAKKKNKTRKSSLPSGDEVHYLQAGFPMPSKEKYIPILLNYGYTIVIVDQVTEPPNPERQVTEILSPGTCIQTNSKKTNYLVSIYIDSCLYKSETVYMVGISSIDLSTGKNYYHNICYHSDKNYWSDELSRLLNFYEPSEILVHMDNVTISKQEFIHKWDIQNSLLQFDYFKESMYKKPSYQNEFLNRIFQLNSMISPLEFFGFVRKTQVALSYVYMIAYIYEHKSDILTNIEQPQEYITKDYLTLHSNSIRQLNVVNNYSYYRGKFESLYELCNRCQTSMGKRQLKQRMLYPLLDAEKIQQRYDKINYFKDHIEPILPYLKHISDLEKFVRLIGLKSVEPYDLYSGYLSYKYVKKLFNVLQYSLFFNKQTTQEVVEKFTEFQQELDNTFHWDQIGNSPCTQQSRSIFHKGVLQDLDELDDKIGHNLELLDYLTSYLSKYIDSKNKHCFKWDRDKQDNWFLYCTNRRAQTFKQNLKHTCSNVIKVKKDSDILFSINIEDICYRKQDKSNTIVEFPQILDISKQLKTHYKQLKELQCEHYDLKLNHIYNTYSSCLKQVNDIISDIDVSHCGWEVAKAYNYSCPQIVHKQSSFVDVKDLRHPLVERINDTIEYTTNDICLTRGCDGMLLFGTNACGKSTFMKAIGLNVILAQMGFFVSASRFEYYPFQQLFTRILNNDNIFRSQSSFAVEIEELRSLLMRSCENSLVLGDELCSGTETNSALSIVSTGLHTLSEKHCKFIFTSHLHQLTEIELVKEIRNLLICHLKIKFEGDQLIYDRKLQPGSGPPVYGLKVCEALGMPIEFVNTAYKIQKSLLNECPKQSNYNQNVIVDKCEICKQPAQETDHIKEQCLSDERGMIDHFHKHTRHNLVTLCKSCHSQKTHGNLIIDGWEQTSQGRQLKFHFEKKSSKKKYNQTQIKKILTYKQQYQNDITNTIKVLDLQENIQISKKTLQQIMEGIY